MSTGPYGPESGRRTRSADPSPLPSPLERPTRLRREDFLNMSGSGTPPGPTLTPGTGSGPTATSGSATASASTVSGYEKKVFKQIPLPRFDGLQENYDDWSYRFDAICASIDERLCKLLTWTTQQTDVINDLDLESWKLIAENKVTDTSLPSAVKLSRELHTQLVNCCSGTAANIVKSNKTIKNGF